LLCEPLLLFARLYLPTTPRPAQPLRGHALVTGASDSVCAANGRKPCGRARFRGRPLGNDRFTQIRDGSQRFTGRPNAAHAGIIPAVQRQAGRRYRFEAGQSLANRTRLWQELKERRSADRRYRPRLGFVPRWSPSRGRHPHTDQQQITTANLTRPCVGVRLCTKNAAYQNGRSTRS
jgi:hypothetical protein